MAKRNNIYVSFKDMTTRKTERVILELLNHADKADGYTIEADKFFNVAYPVDESPIKYIAISEGTGHDDITIEYNSGVIVYGEAYHLSRCTEKYNAFTATEVELPKPW